jgi:predicted O-methyltransferase YrrM
MRSSTDSLSEYVKSLQKPLSETLLKIEARLRQDDKWGINIGAVEGQILQFLIKTYQIKNILEIGTQYGYSTQWMLEALPSEGKLLSLEKDPEHHQVAKSFVVDPRAQFLLGDAAELLKSLNDKEYDLIFIDANKKAYPEYLKWAETHVSTGGLIIGDNTFLFGQVFENEPADPQKKGMWQAMRLFNERLFANPNFETCILPTAEGLTVARRK